MPMPNYSLVYEIVVLPRLDWLPRAKGGFRASGGGFGFHAYTQPTSEDGRVAWVLRDIALAIAAQGEEATEEEARKACTHAALDHFGMSYDIFSKLVTQFR